jgi:ribosome-binding protein aMBF1 (putative translation factor)
MDQDWKNITWSKGGQSHTNNNNINKKPNKHQQPTKKERALLDEDFVPKAPPTNIKILIMQARTNNKLTRKQLAASLQVKEDLIAQWETGKSAPSGQIKAKLQNKLKIKL